MLIATEGTFWYLGIDTPCAQDLSLDPSLLRPHGVLLMTCTKAALRGVRCLKESEDFPTSSDNLCLITYCHCTKQGLPALFMDITYIIFRVWFNVFF